MASYKQQKNLFGNRDVYNKYYGDFRGVDFSSDHTQVAEGRLAYSVNMYKDYRSGQGGGIETVPGFRSLFEIDSSGGENDDRSIYGMRGFLDRHDELYPNRLIYHSGDRLKCMSVGGQADGYQQYMTVELGAPTGDGNFEISFDDVLPVGMYAKVNSVYSKDKGLLMLWGLGEGVTTGGKITFSSELAEEGDEVTVYYRIWDYIVTSKEITPETEEGPVRSMWVELGAPNDGSFEISFEGLIPDGAYANVVMIWNPIRSMSSVVPTECKDNVFKLSVVMGDVTNAEGDDVFVAYQAIIPAQKKELILTEKKSTSFFFHDCMYWLNGEKYLQFKSGEMNCRDIAATSAKLAYMPTTYINNVQSGENADLGEQKEQRNALSPYFRETFIPDGETSSFYLHEELEDNNGIEAVYLYGWPCIRLAVGEEVPDTDKGRYYYAHSDHITFVVAPAVNNDYPDNYAGIEIIAEKQWKMETADKRNIKTVKCISGCTVSALFDDRVFLSGNPDFPNRVWFSALNNPLYFPVVNYIDVGSNVSFVTGFIPVSGTLVVLKDGQDREGSVYYLPPEETGDPLYPVRYQRQAGLFGTGAVGACANFLDDPVFISKYGLEGIGQLSAGLERALGHRSSLVDAKLTNLDLSKATMAVWREYLLILIEGKIFMADSRQRYADDMGNLQYEWYYLEDIGVFEGQYEMYRYAEHMPSELFDDDGSPKRDEQGGYMFTVEICDSCGKAISDCGCGSNRQSVGLPIKYCVERKGEVANAPDENGQASVWAGRVQREIIYDDGSAGDIWIPCCVQKSGSGEYEVFLCEQTGEYIGGVFCPACCLEVIHEVSVCARDVVGDIYNLCGAIQYCKSNHTYMLCRGHRQHCRCRNILGGKLCRAAPG